MGSRVWGLGVGFGVLWLGVWSLESGRLRGLRGVVGFGGQVGLGVQGSGFRVQGSGFGVWSLVFDFGVRCLVLGV